jgi:hypothetical protein
MSHGKKPPKNENEVGYGKPPMHARFRKGQSGNPSGRPRGAKGAQAHELVLKEAYRNVKVREGESVVTLPAIQAIFLSQLALAAKGNGPAQRAVIATVQAIEQDISTQEVARANSETKAPAMSDLELARRIAFALSKPFMKKGSNLMSLSKDEGTKNRDVR